MDCNQAGSSVHGIFQEKILEWMATPSSKVSSWPRDGTRVSLSLLHGQVSSLPLAPNRKSYDFYCSCSWRLKSSIPSAKTRPGADCGSDHELLIAKFRLKLKKVGKTTRPFRYDLNQFPYDHTVEVTNRFKGLDRKSAWKTIDGDLRHCTGGSDQDHPQEKVMQKVKMVVWGGLYIAE